MILLRGLGAGLLWILAGLVGLVGGILCVTVILLPVGIPLLLVARKLFAYSMVVLTPGRVRRPLADAKDSARSAVTERLGRRRPASSGGAKKARR